MMRKASANVLALLSAVCLAASVVAQSAPTRPDVRSLLSQPEIEDDRGGNLAALFRTGDEKIGDLIRLLDDVEPNVSNNAQMVIRYLGNRSGMDALIRHYAKSDQTIIAGPVPLPLTDWDYDFISSTYLNSPENFGELSTQYLYALALDGSPRAKELLSRMLETAKAAKVAPFTLESVNSIGAASTFSASDVSVAAEALRASNFLRPADKEHATAKLIAFNKAQDKALLEIYVNHGVLAEEIYHIVVNKSGQGWRFFSISLIAIS